MNQSSSTFDRETVIHLLMKARTEDRLVVEFQNVGGEIRALDVTDHLVALEEEADQ